MPQKYYLLTPGPTPVPPDVALAEARPIQHHRTPQFQALLPKLETGLQQIFQTQHPVCFFAASGTGGMEAAVTNLLSPGDTAIALVAGKFGERWGNLCQRYGITVRQVTAPAGRAIDPAEVAEALKQTPQAKAVYATLTETSTGVVHDIQAIGAVVARTPAVLVVDAVSGLGGDELRTDDWHCDVVVSGSQKGLMLPPGLAFVSVSPKALALIKAAKLPRYYFDLLAAIETLKKPDTPFTPAISLLTALEPALQRLQAETLPVVLARHRALAEGTRRAIRALGLTLFAERPSNVVTAVQVPDRLDGKALVKRMRDHYGVVIAGGQAELAGRIFRIAHLGYMARFDLTTAVAALELALKDQGYAVTLGAGLTALQESELPT